ncbi:MAG: hypothetical protein ACRD1X_03185, partial [Vicinamibacteria bacterium]
NATAEKETRWREIEQEVDQIEDRLGRPVDEGIKETIVALKVNGFGTTASCEGHLEWGRPYPWVRVESSVAESLLGSARYSEFQEKAGRERKGGEFLTLEERDEARKLVLAQIEANGKEYERLSEMLAEFYDSPEGRRRARPVQLRIEKGPWNQSYLVPDAVQHLGRRARESDSKDRAMKVKALASYRDEMERFTEFLRERFFKG